MEYELTHWGIKGMRWGVRRFQNTDGTRTAAGKKRYRSGSKAKDEDSKDKTQVEDVEVTKQRILKSRSAKELYVNAHLFNQNELQSAYNRLNLERQIKDLIPNEVNKGKEFADKVSSTTKTVSDLINNTSNLYNNVAKVYNTFPELNKGGDPLPLIGGNKKKND